MGGPDLTLESSSRQLEDGGPSRPSAVSESGANVGCILIGPRTSAHLEDISGDNVRSNSQNLTASEQMKPR